MSFSLNDLAGTPARLLVVSGALEMLVASLLGFVMLVPMQPWGAPLARRLPSVKQLLSVHLDLVMLSLMQLGAAAGVAAAGGRGGPLAGGLLVYGGWMGAAPYVFRMAKINAFVIGGGPPQRLAALLSLSGVLATVAAWTLFLWGWLGG
jgi:hypothetical protein